MSGSILKHVIVSNKLLTSFNMTGTSSVKASLLASDCKQSRSVMHGFSGWIRNSAVLPQMTIHDCTRSLCTVWTSFVSGRKIYNFGSSGHVQTMNSDAITSIDLSAYSV